MRHLVRTKPALVGVATAAVALAAVGAAFAATASWTQLSAPTSPPPRYAAAMALDRDGDVLLFGGNGANLGLGDTWLWNGTTWTQPATSTAPSGRAGAAVATDRNGNVVLFGGIKAVFPDPPDFKSDTWLWNGSTWAQVANGVAPAARYGAMMALDVDGDVVLFGGQGPSGDLSDTWLWNGSTWAQAPAGTAPSPRVNAAMATDENGHVVLFGGFHSGTTYQDTWLWDGAGWSNVTPATSPPPLANTASATAADGTVVVFGGSGPGGNTPPGFFDETWLWDGTTWAEAVTTAAPAARANAGMARDRDGAILLFGGFRPSAGAAGDTWLFGAPDTVPPVITVPAGVAADATGPAGAVVTYTVTVSDETDPAPELVCIPVSSSLFAVGDTSVACTATDASLNEATAGFTVHVAGAAEQLADLADAVEGVGPGVSLADKIEEAQAAIADGDEDEACEILHAFSNQVRAQSGNKIPAETATVLIADANRIRAVLDCY